MGWTPTNTIAYYLENDNSAPDANRGFTGSFTKIMAINHGEAVQVDTVFTASLSNITFAEYKRADGTSSADAGQHLLVSSVVTGSIKLQAGTVIEGTPHILQFNIDSMSMPVLAYADGKMAAISSSGDKMGTQF